MRVYARRHARTYNLINHSDLSKLSKREKIILKQQEFNGGRVAIKTVPVRFLIWKGVEPARSPALPAYGSRTSITPTLGVRS